MSYSKEFDKTIRYMISGRIDGDTCVETAEIYVDNDAINEDPELQASLKALNDATSDMIECLKTHYTRLNLSNEYDFDVDEL